jgi:hypothetical protein
MAGTLTAMERLHLTRRQLASRLPDGGAPGWTAYATAHGMPEFGANDIDADTARDLSDIATESDTGSVLFVERARMMLVVPPFPVEVADAWSEIHLGPLRELLSRERVVGAFLIRRGGFTMGVFRGAYLVDSKTDRRFVKNRHRKGGQSSRRFERIREKQVSELFAKACGEAREKFEPYEGEIEHVFFGGDRLTLQAFRKECSYFERFGERVRQRVLHVPGDPRRESLDGLPGEIWSSEAYVWDAVTGAE